MIINQILQQKINDSHKARTPDHDHNDHNHEFGLEHEFSQ